MNLITADQGVFFVVSKKLAEDLVYRILIESIRWGYEDPDLWIYWIYVCLGIKQRLFSSAKDSSGTGLSKASSCFCTNASSSSCDDDCFSLGRKPSTGR